MNMTPDTAIFLFDVSGVMARPWLDAGYECWIVDIQHPPGITTEGRLHKVNANLTRRFPLPVPKERIAFAFAFPPCGHMAVSGARWFQGKGLRKLETSIAMFATAAEFCEETEAPYGIENPVSTISTYWRKPDHIFSPDQFTGFELGDNYTKKTCLWTGGGFVMPGEFRAPDLPPPDERIHKCPPGPERHNIRSATPLGFARAVFAVNGKPLILETA